MSRPFADIRQYVVDETGHSLGASGGLPTLVGLITFTQTEWNVADHLLRNSGRFTPGPTLRSPRGHRTYRSWRLARGHTNGWGSPSARSGFRECGGCCLREPPVSSDSIAMCELLIGLARGRASILRILAGGEAGETGRRYDLPCPEADPLRPQTVVAVESFDSHHRARDDPTLSAVFPT